MATYTSQYDKKYLNKEDYDLVQQYKQDYANATTPEERQQAHANAESIRDKYKYSGGGDGSDYIGKSGLNISPDTDQALNKYGTYTPSASVTAAQNYLSQVQSSKPGGYVSKWEGQITDIYNKIVNRDKFSYDLNSDMLYQQYKDQYTALGEMAMMDTMGQAAGLTGGYGNTYAQNAGQQAYQSYLRQINEVVPELYGMARDQHNQETQDLYNQFSMTQTLEDTDYGRYRDSVSDYQWELGFAADQYNAERNYDFGVLESNRNYAMNIANMESEQASENRSYAYDTAMNMISSGVMPSADMLSQAGISDADAYSLVQMALSKRSNGGGGGGKTTGNSTSTASTGNYKAGVTSATGAGSISDVVMTIKSQGWTGAQAESAISGEVAAGELTEDQAEIARKMLGLK